MQQQYWRNAHEAKVEKFYARGVEHYGNHHGGYLNFGLWNKGINNYVAAAENLILTVAGPLKLNRDSRLLDVACGLAVQDILLHEKTSCEIDALDLTWKHVASGRERVKDAGYSEYIRIHHGSATQLPFPDNSYSQVLGIEGPAHFDTREDFFREAQRVLKPGGSLALSDYVINNPRKSWVHTLFLKAVCFLWHAPAENRDTIEEYKTKLTRAGFTNIIIEPVGKDVIPGYYFENCKKETIEGLEEARGYFAAHAGRIIDYVMYKVFTRGLIEYIIVRAEKA